MMLAAQLDKSQTLPMLDLGFFQRCVSDAWQVVSGHLDPQPLGLVQNSHDARYLKAMVRIGQLQVVAVFPGHVAAGIARELFASEREDLAELDPLVYDFVGEFTNVIAGMLVTYFEEAGYKVLNMGVPVRALATRLQDLHAVWAVVRFTSHFGPMWVSVEEA